jgi:Flp pilus assembly CpaE family ATPase
MHESKRIFLVCTPEIPSLHLAREKYLYLQQLDLHERVCILLNRCQKRPLITPEQIEQLLGVPVTMTFPNDYQGVHRALTFGRWVEPASELGKQFSLLAQSMLENRPQAIDHRKRFIEFFSVPNKSSITEMKKTAV